MEDRDNFQPNAEHHFEWRLVERALRGNRDAFRELVERYQQRVHAVAINILGDFDDALDVTQETFIRAHKALASFRGQSSFYTWLYRITFNLAIDLKRKKGREKHVSVGDMSELDALENKSSDTLNNRPISADSALANRELGDKIEQALTGLSPEHRAVLMLREVDGLSYAEISDVVGCSKGTVMSRLHHARKYLKQALLALAPEAVKELIGRGPVEHAEINNKNRQEDKQGNLKF